MEDILMLYYEINNIYLELYMMELSDDRNSNMFLELIDLLSEKINEEKELFLELSENINDKEYDVLCRLDEVVDNPFTKRIVDYMRFYNDSGDYAKLYVACTRNVYLIYLSFLQEYIDKIEYESLRKGILSYKYYNSFICHDVFSVMHDSVCTKLRHRQHDE
jgi:thiaminase